MKGTFLISFAVMQSKFLTVVAEFDKCVLKVDLFHGFSQIFMAASEDQAAVMVI